MIKNHHEHELIDSQATKHKDQSTVFSLPKPVYHREKPLHLSQSKSLGVLSYHRKVCACGEDLPVPHVWKQISAISEMKSA